MATSKGSTFGWPGCDDHASRDSCDLIQGETDHPVIDLVLDELPVSVEEPAGDVADHVGRDQFGPLRTGNVRRPSGVRSILDAADTDEGRIGRSRPRERLRDGRFEDEFLRDGSAADDDRCVQMLGRAGVGRGKGVGDEIGATAHCRPRRARLRRVRQSGRGSG